jgi:nucleotide-binding universal stress UspA family protein
MPTIDHVTCPIDLSPSTRPLLSHAAAWARWYEAGLHVLHVEPRPALLGDPLGGVVMMAPGRPMHEVRVEVARMVADMSLGDVRCSLDVLEGPLVETILDEARRRPHSMLIMSSHGRTGLDRIVHGSVTASVTHHAPCAVLVVPPRQSDDAEPLPQFTRILCAVDFLPSSLAGLRHALQLAEQTGAHLEVVHVLETTGEHEAAALRHFGVPDHRARFEEALEDLRRRIPERARRWCTVHERVAAGHPAWTLLRIAEEAQADLIVMGSGDRFHLRSMWLGGVTDRVIRSAHAPVLIVPAAAAGPLGKSNSNTTDTLRHGSTGGL